MILNFSSVIEPTNSGRIIHTCKICGNRSIWQDTWRWKYIFHKGSGNGDPGWEEKYITCSDECREKEKI